MAAEAGADDGNLVGVHLGPLQQIFERGGVDDVGIGPANSGHSPVPGLSMIKQPQPFLTKASPNEWRSSFQLSMPPQCMIIGAGSFFGSLK